LIGFYLTALPYQTVAYIVQQEKTTLAEDFQVAVKYEKGMSTLHGNPNTPSQKTEASSKKLDPNQSHHSAESSEATNLASIHKLVLKLSNDVLSLKKTNG